MLQHYLSNIDEGRDLNAFIFVLRERAAQKAREVDAKVKAGTAGKLAGTILAVKDIIAIKDERLTCGSRMLENYVSPFSATAIERLEARDAIIIGKTNLDEFAMGSSNEHSNFGPTHNPRDKSRVTGGSSGGSCAAVAADMALAALGTDTGGSIRQPASFCGVVGLKPSYGRVSRYGLVAFASSFEQIGPITRNVEDAAILLEAIAGHDARDATSAPAETPAISANLQRKPHEVTIGLPKEYFGEGVAPEVQTQLGKAITFLRGQGVRFVEVSLPHTDYAIAAYYIMSSAEASSNLARYDGARYGFRAPDVNTLEEMYRKSRSQGFGEEVKRRIMLGAYVLSAGYYDAYYRNAQKVRTLIIRDFERVFSQCDCLLTPTSPTTAFKIGEKAGDPLSMYMSDVFTVSVNLAGLPAISIPYGTDSQGLPVGVQLIGQPYDELTILQVAGFLEKPPDEPTETKH